MNRGKTGLRQRSEKQQGEGNDNIHTLDGSVNLKGEPSVRSQSGGWRACPFILGTSLDSGHTVPHLISRLTPLPVLFEFNISTRYLCFFYRE